MNGIRKARCLRLSQAMKLDCGRLLGEPSARCGNKAIICDCSGLIPSLTPMLVDKLLMSYTFHSRGVREIEPMFKRLRHPAWRPLFLFIVGITYLGGFCATAGIELMPVYALLRFRKEHSTPVILPLLVVVISIVGIVCTLSGFSVYRLSRDRIISIDRLVLFIGSLFAFGESVWLLFHPYYHFLG
jgi:hypothetical protein